MLGTLDARVRSTGLPFATFRHGKGLYYYTNWAGGQVANQTYAQNRIVAHPTLIPYQTSIVEIGVWAVTGGGVGATTRLLIYGDTNSQPDYLIYDSGATAATSTGVAIYFTAAPLPITLTPGTYWFGQLNQGSATSVVVSGYTNANSYPIGCTTRQGTAQSTCGIYTDGWTGAPPANLTGIGPIASCGQYWIKTL